MRISKREFINSLKGRHVFIGVSYAPVDMEKLMEIKRNVLNAENLDAETRTLRKVTQSYLEFSDDSRLYLGSFDKREYLDVCDVLEVMVTEAGNKEPDRYLYYLPID